MAIVFSSKVGRIIMIAASALAIVGYMIIHFNGASVEEIDAQKRSELSQIYTLLQFYYVGESKAPVSPTRDGWCVINEFYGKDRCMSEVVRDGYAEAIPQSPDERPYLYYDDPDRFFVASQMSRDLPLLHQCPFSDDPRMWCKFFEK